jgi:hypothetical protein
MKGVIKIFIVTAAISLVNVFTALSQNASTAVMEIRVEVISGAMIERNDAVQTFIPNADEIAYGEFTVSLPDGTEVLTNYHEEIEMTTELGTWMLNSRMDVEKDAYGKLNFSFTAKGNKNIQEGHHTGIQVATIEYL